MQMSVVSHSAAAARVQRQASSLKTKLSNGLTIVAKDNCGPVSQLVLAFRAGSRYQTGSQSGLVHHIRNFVGRDVQSYPGLQLVWSAAANGANLTSFSTRDVFGVRINVSRDDAAHALSILGQVGGNPAFKPWEFEDVIPTLHADNSHKNPYNVVFEDIHRAAFRNGPLANSIFASRSEIGRYKNKDLSKFAEQNFVSGNGVLVGINVDTTTLKNYADESGSISDGSTIPVNPSPYKGGDFRRSRSGNDTHIIIAGSGAGIKDKKALAIQAVYLSHVGKVSPLKFATLPGTSSALGKLPTGVVGSSFQAVYEDTGIVGAYILTRGSQADAAVRSAVAGLKSPKIDDIEGSKRRAIYEILASSENSSCQSINEAINALGNGSEPSEIISEIGSVTAKDVEEFAKKAFAKISIASYGDVSRVPYSDEL